MLSTLASTPWLGQRPNPFLAFSFVTEFPIQPTLASNLQSFCLSLLSNWDNMHASRLPAMLCSCPISQWLVQMPTNGQNSWITYNPAALKPGSMSLRSPTKKVSPQELRYEEGSKGVQLILPPGEWAQGQLPLNLQTQQKMDFAYCEELMRNISKEIFWKDYTHTHSA